MTSMKNELSLEVRERSLRPVIDTKGENGSGWQAILSIEARIVTVANARNDWVKQAGIDSAKWTGILAEMEYQMKAQERDNCRLCRANEIVC